MRVFRVRFNRDGSIRAANLREVDSITNSMSENNREKHIPEVVKARIVMLRLARSTSDLNETTIVEGLGRYYWDEDDRQYGEVFRVIVPEGADLT